MIDTNVYVLSPLLLLLDKACRETSAARVHNGSALFFFDGRVKTQILPTRETEGPEFLYLALLLSTILHQRLELSKGLFNLRGGS